MTSVLSIVVPAYNESEGIEEFHHSILLPELQKLAETLQILGGEKEPQTVFTAPFEIVYVNDGSSDDTLLKLQQLAEENSFTKVVNLSRNFGKEVATTAGVGASDAAAIIMMDADGQHPPAYLGQFLEEWRKGAQVVIGVRSNHQGNAAKTLGSKAFYKIQNLISDSEIVPSSTDYRLIDRAVTQEFLRLTERPRITRGLIDWLGFKRAFVEFEAPERLAGEATYSMRKLMSLALNSFTTMSVKPLFLFGYLGFFITVLSFVAGVIIFTEQFLLGDPLIWNFTGSALLGIFVTFLVGIVLTAQGMMALYLSHIYAEAQGRPLYVIDRANSRHLR